MHQKVYAEAHKYLLVTSVNQTFVFRGTKSKEQLFVEGWQSTQPGADFYGIGKVNKYFFRALNTLWAGCKQFCLRLVTSPQ
uniref:Uncharacterized protein n=1 Tax=Ditylenchus dipsaci TaxID=166011 RepID=A0A915EC33_9BILA